MDRFAGCCLTLALLTACTDFATRVCADDQACPAGRVCDEEGGRCVLPQQVVSCEGIEDGARCEFLGSAGACDQGVCIASECGDGALTGDEVCDGDFVPTCGEQGFDRGVTSCTASCEVNTSACRGVGWTPRLLPISGAEILELWFATPELGFAVTTRRASSGDVIEVLRIGPESVTPEDVVFNRVWGRSKTEVYGVSSDQVFVFDGEDWAAVPNVVPNGLPTGDKQAVWGDGARVFVPGFSFDGTEWTAESEATVPHVFYRDAHYGLAGDELRRRDSAGGWTAAGSSPLGIVKWLHVVGDELLAIDTAGNVARTSVVPFEWTVDAQALALSGAGVVHTWQPEDGTIYVLSDAGTVDSYRRGWQRLAPPIANGYPVKMAGVGDAPIVVYTSSYHSSAGWHLSQPTTSIASANEFFWSHGREFQITGGTPKGWLWYGTSYAREYFFHLDLQACGGWGRSPEDAIVIANPGASGSIAMRWDGAWDPPIGDIDGGTLPAPPIELNMDRCPLWADPLQYWLGGTAGQLASFDLVSWKTFELPTTSDLVAISGAGGTLAIIADVDGDVFDLEEEVVPDQLFIGNPEDGWEEVLSDRGLRSVYAASAADIFVVGPRSYRYDGSTVTEIELPRDVLGVPIFVHGRDTDDVFIVTSAGELVHLDGDEWSRVRVDFSGAARLFVTETDVFVGGPGWSSALTRLFD